VELSNVIEKIEKLNPKIQITEIVEQVGDYVVFVGQMGEDDVPHYFVGNSKYGVIEASCSTYRDTPKMLAAVAGEEAPRKKPQLDLNFN
jgi:hypothetical protein